MKSATIPSVRVEPELREELERVLHDGESLSAFVEASVRETVRRRQQQAEFVARGMASLKAAERSGVYVAASTVIDKLQARLEKASGGKGRANARRR